MTTFPRLLAALRAAGDSAPFLTWYAEGPGSPAERVELSVATYANWIAKTSSLLNEEFEVERGDHVLIDLPNHWLVPIFAGACWTLGAVAVTPSAAQSPVVADAPDPGPLAVTARLRICGPGGWAVDPELVAAQAQATLACSLHPLAMRFAEPIPAGVRDYGVEVWGQPDGFAPFDPPEGTDAATLGSTQAELFGADGVPAGGVADPAEPAGPGQQLPRGARVQTRAHLLSPAGSADFAAVLQATGSLVLCQGGDDAWYRHIGETEHVTIQR